MNEQELREIALRFVGKGYLNHDKLRDSDDLYDATADEKDECCNYIDEIQENGTKAFIAVYGL